MAKVRLIGYVCERCGHQWVPRDAAIQPKVCPKCKSPYWDRPRGDYDEFKEAVRRVLREAGEPVTWTEVRERGNLPQKWPNNKWVRRMETDIGLLRNRAGGKTVWSLAE